MVPTARRSPQPASPTHAAAVPRPLVEYRVIGDLPTQPYHLLLAGTDGRAYVFDLVSGAIVPHADEAGWTGTCPVDPTVN